MDSLYKVQHANAIIPQRYTSESIATFLYSDALSNWEQLIFCRSNSVLLHLSFDNFVIIIYTIIDRVTFLYLIPSQVAHIEITDSGDI